MKTLFAAIAAFGAGALAGVLLEHYVGTAAIIDWSGLRHADARPPVAQHGRSRRSPARRHCAANRSWWRSFSANRTPRTAVKRAARHIRRCTSSTAAGCTKRATRCLARKATAGACGSGLARRPSQAATSGRSCSCLSRSARPRSRAGRPSGSLHDALLKRIAQAQASGLRFTHLLWHQGEADAQRGTAERSLSRKLSGDARGDSQA